MRTSAKEALTHLGAACTERNLGRLNSAIDYMETGRWMRSRGFAAGARVTYREQVFQTIARDANQQEVLYMEFGVYQGASMRYWSKLLANPRSHLHGFDSFEGLPDGWTGEPRGHFSTDGRVPEIDDSRVRFFPGWFEDTLPVYDPPGHEQLVVSIDSDLYASAACVLREIEPLIVPGSYVYFDEFSDRANELRAFDEFLERTSMRFRLVGATRELACVAFQRLS